MVSPLRLKEMICLAAFEEGRGRKDFRIAGYDRADYIAIRLIGSFFLITAADAVLLALYIVWNFENPSEIYILPQAGRIAALILIFYIVSAAIYLAVSWAAADRKWKGACARVRSYEERILKLEEFAGMEESAERDDGET